MKALPCRRLPRRRGERNSTRAQQEGKTRIGNSGARIDEPCYARKASGSRCQTLLMGILLRPAFPHALDFGRYESANENAI